MFKSQNIVKNKHISISFIFPGHAHIPCGGNKVINEYANCLVKDGFNVNLVYAGSLFWRKKSLYYKLTNCFRYIERIIKGYTCRNWFNLDSKVKEYYVFSLNYRFVPKSDIYICTSPYTSMYVKDYPTDKKWYFIQGYENWGNVTDEILRATYHYPLHKIVISNWLKHIIEEESLSCTIIPNGYDIHYFQYDIPVENKDKYNVCMVFYSVGLKDCQLGFSALSIVKEHFPQLKVTMFGVPSIPDNLPDWYIYYQSPDRETQNRIYNEAAIFIGTSQVEGWGLTIGEAMLCGAAVACTDNPGYLEMAHDNVTALVSPVRNSEALASNIIRLIEDDALRYRIAETGHRYIKNFTWDKSYLKLKKELGLI